MSTNNEYHFSIFRPGTEYGKKNRNIIITFVIIWAVAIFGFQILLKIMEKPTPEKALTRFEAVWDNVKAGTATTEQNIEFVQSLVYVTGKLTVKDADRNIVDTALSSVLLSLIPDSERTGFLSEIASMKEAQAKMAKANDQEFLDLQKTLQEKQLIVAGVCSKYSGFNLGTTENRVLSFHVYPIENPGDASYLKEKLPSVMKLYLTHLQSVLTDTIFLGFPFHYFYTAELLLFLFVALCLIYAIRIEKLNKKYSITE